MSTQIVHLQVQPELVSAFMDCFALPSLRALKDAQDAGYQFMNPSYCCVDVVLTKPEHVSADIDEEGTPITRRAANHPTPTTLEELRGSPAWRSTLRLLARSGKTIMVAEGEAVMGRYQAVVITRHGFQLEEGKSGMSAAFSKPNTKHTPLRGAKKLVEKVRALSQPLSDDPPGTPTPTEREIVTKVFRKIEELRSAANK